MKAKSLSGQEAEEQGLDIDQDYLIYAAVLGREDGVYKKAM